MKQGILVEFFLSPTFSTLLTIDSHNKTVNNKTFFVQSVRHFLI